MVVVVEEEEEEEEEKEEDRWYQRDAIEEPREERRIRINRR